MTTSRGRHADRDRLFVALAPRIELVDAKANLAHIEPMLGQLSEVGGPPRDPGDRVDSIRLVRCAAEITRECERPAFGSDRDPYLLTPRSTLRAPDSATSSPTFVETRMAFPSRPATSPSSKLVSPMNAATVRDAGRR